MVVVAMPELLSTAFTSVRTWPPWQVATAIADSARHGRGEVTVVRPLVSGRPARSDTGGAGGNIVRRRWPKRLSRKVVAGGKHVLELTMAAVSAADEDATGGMYMADAPSEPGSALRVGRDQAVCRLATPEDWLFVSRVQLEFLYGPDGAWQVSWLRGSQANPVSDVRLTVGQFAQPIGYGATVPLPRGANGKVAIHDRTAPRSIEVGFYHET